MLRISFQLAALASSTFSYLRMPALLTRMSRRPNFCAAPLTKARHAASLPTSACVKATLAPAGLGRGPHALAALAVAIAECHDRALGDETPDRRLADPRGPARHRCDLAVEPSHVRHLSLRAKRVSTIRRIHPAGTALLARPGHSTLTGCESFRASAFGTLRRADSLRLGSNLPGSGARARRSGIGAFQFPGRCPHHCRKMPHSRLPTGTSQKGVEPALGHALVSGKVTPMPSLCSLR